MVTTVRSLGLTGIAGYEVAAECFLSGGLPAFDIVGLPDAAVREARERVRAAVKNCGAKFPVSRITVNLAPAGTKKAGTVYGFIFQRILLTECLATTWSYNPNIAVTTLVWANPRSLATTRGIIIIFFSYRY